jgi:histidine ammonia-lyase
VIFAFHAAEGSHSFTAVLRALCDEFIFIICASAPLRFHHIHKSDFHLRNLRITLQAKDGGIGMGIGLGRLRRLTFGGLVAMSGIAAFSAPSLAYQPITPTMEGATVTLTGHDLTIEQVIDVARHGAKVQLSPEARQRSLDAYGLLLEAQAEGVVMYGFNRNYGAGRQEVSLEGDPLSPENKAKLEERQMSRFRAAPMDGYGPEVGSEDIVRAMMVVRANTMTYEFASPQLTQMLLDLLNKGVTPVVQSRGTPGEADLAQLTDLGGTMVGVGDAYYRGVRMPAAEALEKAGLKPIQPFAGDDYALDSTNAYAVGIAALLVADSGRALDWADLIYAMDLGGMNSSITPLTWPVQVNRPQKWLNWQAARVLDMLKGSYLFADDPNRILQDPESLRASAVRQGSAWASWGNLRDSVLLQINSSDHNPAVLVGMSPTDSWELSTPQMMKYYVKGGKYSNGKHGYIVSNANWDPYPISNDVEAFTIALVNMDVAVAQRIDRFGSPFVTGVKPSEILTPEQLHNAPRGGQGYGADTVFQEIAGLANPMSPGGNAGSNGIGDLQSESRIKVARAAEAVDQTMDLLAVDLMTATYWMDIRKAQDPKRDFGAAPDAAWTALRKLIPFQQDPEKRPAEPIGMAAAAFLRDNPASMFYASGPNPPAAEAYPPAGQVRARK